MGTKKGKSLFPDARIALEGGFRTPQGSYVQTIYVDLSGEVEQNGLCLVKATEPQYELATASTIRLSRPGVFRDKGEVLIQDEQEGRARTVSVDAVQVPSEEPGLPDERVAALNTALRLGRTKLSVRGSRRNERRTTSTAKLSFGRDWLIYCTSMRPSIDEEAAWRVSLPASYTSVTPIYRATQFAQGLGLGVCEHIGAGGKPNPVRAVFHGFKAVEELRRSQIVLHGPMVYVDSPYQCIEEAEPGWEKLCAMVFLKSRDKDYAAMKEYRFAMLGIDPEVGDVFDLPVSGVLKDCLSPVACPEGQPAEGAAVVSRDNSPTSEPRPTSRTYTYRRRVAQRRRSGWTSRKPGADDSKEEVIEETVTSPEEVSEPFPSAEGRQPDVIVFHQVGTRGQFIHKAYRNEETQHWRIETLRQSSTLADGLAAGARPPGLVVPPEQRYRTLDVHPLDPRLILEWCLNPSEPKPPIPYADLSRCDAGDLEHVLACGQSLRMAVDLLEGTDQARAAASAWYAQCFILDLVPQFGPIVKSVCIIRKSLSVVELTRAPFTKAVAWAVLSGAGTYLLHIDDGRVEEKVFPGGFSRAGRPRSRAYAELLQRYGWVRM